MIQLSRRGFLTGLSGTAALVFSPPWVRAVQSPFPELRVSGSPGTLGLAHGKAFSAQIGKNVRFYLQWLSKATAANEAKVLNIAHQFEPVLAKYFPDLLEEIDGVAKGAKRSRDQILVLNARTDLLVMAQRKVGKMRAARNGSSFVVAGCTALVLTGEIEGKRYLTLGQNWDWRPELSANTVLLRLKPKDKPTLVTFTEAGMVGKVGFNDQRLGVCLNFLSHKSENPEGPFGVPVHCLLRLVMESASLEQAYKTVAWAPRCASANFMMAQHSLNGPLAMSVEWTPTTVARQVLQGEGLVHTNHFLDTALAKGQEDDLGRSTSNRYEKATQLAQKWQHKIEDPTMRLEKILRDRQGAPYSVSKTAAQDSPSETLAGIIMDLSRNRLLLAKGAPHRAAFVSCPGC
ncbi:MAG: C45 family peptidase [Pseudomonadota bacterium]